ncbi:hypothetical protein ACF06X_33265 [Streptomyces sp. NPDC015346]|uniref:hypothetical protein n=1 Tax=Streptomyces sp. NPDC015346 TaxID=3364954 RepID=UPI003700C345
MPHSKAKQAEVHDRRAKLIRLRREGVPFDDPRILGLGYTSRNAATKDLIRALAENRDAESAEASVYRQQENERLDALQAAIWPQATEKRTVYSRDGSPIGESVDVQAQATVLKIMERRAKLNGLDMPVQTEVSGIAGGPIAVSTADPEKLAAIIAATSRLDTGDPANTATSTPADDDSEGAE